MTSLPEQFSAARLTQLDNSFKLMRSFSEQALERTSRVVSLQLDASRAAVEQSSNAMRQLLAARDPRDLLAIGSQSQQGLRTMFDYSRELFSIAAGVNMPVLRSYSATAPVLDAPAAQPESIPEPAPAPAASAAEVAAEAFERTGSDSASAAAASAAIAVASSAEAPAAADFALPSEAPVETAAAAIEVVTSDIEPQGAQTAMAKATSEALDLPVTPPHPVAASMPVEVAVEIELPKVEPLTATPPAQGAATSGPTETRGTKGRKKQH